MLGLPSVFRRMGEGLSTVLERRGEGPLGVKTALERRGDVMTCSSSGVSDVFSMMCVG